MTTSIGQSEYALALAQTTQPAPSVDIETMILSEAATTFQGGTYVARGLLVSLYQSPFLVADTAAKVTEWDFKLVAGEKFAQVFRAMILMSQRRMVFDRNGFCEVLGLQGGTSHEADDLWNVVQNTVGVDPSNYGSRLTEFRRIAGLMRLHGLARKIQLGIRPDESVASVAGRMSNAFGTVIARYTEPAPPVDLIAAMRDVLDPKSLNLGIPVPSYPRWSAALSGFSPGDLSMVGARTKTGKSLFCLQVGLGFATANVPVLFIDTEMDERVFSRRAAAMLAGITPRGFFDTTNAEKMAEMTKRWECISPMICYRQASGWVGADVVSAIREFRRSLGMGQGVVVYDWFKLPIGDMSRNLQGWQSLTMLTQQIKAAAMEYRLPVLAALQQNRGAIGVRVEDMCDGVEQFAGGSDGIAQFASSSSAIYPATPELIAGFAADPRWSGKDCPVSSLMAVGGNRQGDSRVLIPMTRTDDLVFREVTDMNVLSFVAGFKTSAASKYKRGTGRSRMPGIPGDAVGKIAAGLQVA